MARTYKRKGLWFAEATNAVNGKVTKVFKTLAEAEAWIAKFEAEAAAI